MAGDNAHDAHGDAVARQAAVEAAGADWQVAAPTDETPSHAELRRRLGARPPEGTLAGREAGARAKLAAAGAVAAPPRPAKFSWRSVGGKNYVTPVRDQGDCGSCVAFGVAATIEGTAKVRYGATLAIDLSEAQLFYCIGQDLRSHLRRRLVAGLRVRRGRQPRRHRRGPLPLHRRGSGVRPALRLAEHGHQGGPVARHRRRRTDEAVDRHQGSADHLLHRLRGLLRLRRRHLPARLRGGGGRPLRQCRRLQRHGALLGGQEQLEHLVGRAGIPADRLRPMRVRLRDVRGRLAHRPRDRTDAAVPLLEPTRRPTTSTRRTGRSWVRAASGYVFQETQCYLYPTQKAGTVPLHRFWSTTRKDHVYTLDRNEYGRAGDGYAYEGVVGYAYAAAQPKTVPLYRYWSAASNDHLFTNSQSEGANGRRLRPAEDGLLGAGRTRVTEPEFARRAGPAAG